jgi:hypothetical protein
MRRARKTIAPPNQDGADGGQMRRHPKKVKKNAEMS